MASSLPPPLRGSRLPVPLIPDESLTTDVLRREIHKSQRVPAAQASRSREAAKEIARRKMEALRLYNPLPEQLRFHESPAVERIACGSNRAGKSQVTCAELACYATGVHRWGRAVPAENALIYVVGEHEKHIREVMWKKLARPGAFKIIRDEITKQWRAVVPDQPYDAAYREKWRDAAPFLPERFIKSVAWRSRKDDLPESCTLKNGSKIVFYTSASSPQQGSEIDLWWADEELVRHTWIAELRARSVTRLGSGMYSFAPTTSTPEAYQMWRAARDPKRELRLIDNFFFKIEDNKYLSDEAKRRFFEQLSESDRKKRWYGIFDSESLVVYPEFDEAKHVVDPFAIPDDWTRWMFTDPGVQVCAVLFVGIPPPIDESGKVHPNKGEVHFYDELYIERCTPTMYAQEVRAKMGRFARGGFVGFAIDAHGGRHTLDGVTHLIDLLTAALEQQEVFSVTTGSSYIEGSDDVDGRQECLRALLLPDFKLGKPRLRVHRNCRTFIWEMGEQFFVKNKHGLVSDKRRDAHDHLVWCAEAAAELDPEWVIPPTPEPPVNPIVKAAKNYGGGSSRQQTFFGPRGSR